MKRLFVSLLTAALIFGLVAVTHLFNAAYMAALICAAGAVAVAAVQTRKEL